MSKGLKIALAISVTINVLIAATVIGALSVGSGAAKRPAGLSRGGPPELQAFARALDAPHQEKLRTRLRADPTLRGGRDRIRQARRDVMAAIQADPFAADRLREAFATQRTVQLDLSERGIAILTEIIAELSADERAAFATALEEMIQRRGFRRP